MNNPTEWEILIGTPEDMSASKLYAVVRQLRMRLRTESLLVSNLERACEDLLDTSKEMATEHGDMNHLQARAEAIRTIRKIK